MRISDWSSDVCSSDLDAGPREAVEQARIDDACLVGTADRANEVGGRQALGGEEGEVAAHRLQRRRCESRACRAARALRGNRVEEDLHRHRRTVDVDIDRKSVESGKSESVRVDHGGRRNIKKTNSTTTKTDASK